MTLFLALAALLATGAGLAIAWPILRARGARGPGHREANLAVFSDQVRDLDIARERGEISAESHSRAMEELRQRVREDVDGVPAAQAAPTDGRWVGWIAAACVPALAAVLYVLVGNPGAVAPSPAPAATPAPHALEGAKIAGMAESLAARLRDDPEDAQGWATLGRSLGAVGRYAEAAQAYAEAAKRLPGNASILADRADVLAMAHGRRFEGEPDRLIEAALAADPRLVKALALAGTSAYARGDFAMAGQYWRRLLAVVPAQGETARQVEANAREAERRAQSGAATALAGSVAFAPRQSTALGAADVLFVIARPREGKGRPIAVVRLTPPALPATFRMDDSHSLDAGSPLSAHAEVLLEARLARGGSADPRPGDPRSVARIVRPGDRAIEIELSAAGS